MATPLVDIKSLLETQLSELPLETAFGRAVVRVIVPEGRGRLPLLETLKSVFTNSTPDAVAVHLSSVITFLCSQTNHQRVTQLTSVLRSLAAAGLINTKALCEQLLTRLDLKNELVWAEGLSLISQVIGGVDYKGCRDIMNILLDQYDRLPRSMPEEHLPALMKGQELLGRILNRDASLLPTYFAADAIQRRYQPLKEGGGSGQPHWVLQPVVGELQNSMRTLAEVVSGSVQPYLRPVLGVSNMSLNGWRLDPDSHGCSLKGHLPYRESLRRPQKELLYHLLTQQNSKDAIHSVLGVNRAEPQPSQLVENSLVSLGLVAMELSEECVGEREEQVFEVWSHFASQLVYCHFLQLINITTLLEKLRSKLSHKRLHKGRDWLMWSLLHFSSTVQTKDQPLVMLQKEFAPIFNLFTLLYSDKMPLPVPDPQSPECVYKCAGACVWVVYSNKAAADSVSLPCRQPHLLSQQIEWILAQMESPPGPDKVPVKFTVPLLLNIYSNNSEVSGKLLDILLTSMLPSPEREDMPIPLWALNTLAMHAKIRLMEMIKVHLIKVVKSFKQVPPPTDSPSISSSLLETYSRLLVWLGTRNFQAHLIPAVFESQAWGILHALLEIIVYRVHLQLQYSYRFQLLQQLHTVASVSIIPAQLHCSTENAALKLIQGLNSPEFLLQLAKAQFALDPKPLLSVDSEELNRVFVRVVAQSLATSNTDPANWLDQFMKTVLTTAPNCWSKNTLQYFPTPLRQFCSSCTKVEGQLVGKVDEEARRFAGLSTEVEQIRQFVETDSSAYFVCVLWKGLMTEGTVNPVLIKVAQRTQPKKLGAFTRKLVDYIIYSTPQPTPSEHISKVSSKLLELVWQYNLFTIDRLALCMLLRGYESDLEMVCVSIVCELLLASKELHKRLKSLVEMVPSDYWRREDWSKKHTRYNATHPESFQCDMPGLSGQGSTLPMHFGNMCLRLLPVMDLLIQRLLEVPQAAQQYLLQLMEAFKTLYKYHDQPVTFLYFTLHYYSNAFTHHPEWKLLLTSCIVGSQHDVHSLDWYFTPQLTELLKGLQSGVQWTPSKDYFKSIVHQLLKGLRPFDLSGPVTEWHFSEFSSPMTFALYTTYVELMCVPMSGQQTTLHLLQTTYNRADEGASEEELMSWINAVTLVLVSLPESYHSALYQEIVLTLSSPTADKKQSCLLSMVHAYWQHANLGLLLSLPQWLQSVLHPLVISEERLVFVCRLLGPLLNRLTSEKPKLLLDVVLEIYKMVQLVDKEQKGHMSNSDLICDYLYHIKYMHIGTRAEIEAIINTLHTPLKWRLRFMHSDKTG